MVCPCFYSSTHVLISYSTLWSIRWKGGSSYKGLHLYNAKPDSNFPSFMESTEVKCRADIHYGPDDPTLWPQPWVESYCHLGSIPRKPDNPNDSLSIMWWDLSCDDFESFGGSIVNGLGQLLGLKLLSLQKMMSSKIGRAHV